MVKFLIITWLIVSTICIQEQRKQIENIIKTINGLYCILHKKLGYTVTEIAKNYAKYMKDDIDIVEDKNDE